MKKKYIKFSDERNKKYSIKTIIGNDNGVNYVIKKAIYPEGKKHLETILSNYNLLLDGYDIQPCKSWNFDEGIAFEYIEGESLTKKYLQAVQSNDIELYKQLLTAHKHLIIGREENITVYQSSDAFKNIFGEDELFEGKPALEICNFDAISSNIIYHDDDPIFVDYEWVYDFKIPVDLAVYHCVTDMYLHDISFEKFMSLDDVIDYLELDVPIEILQKSIESFHRYIISENENESYALVKAICLKQEKHLADIMHEKLICECEIDRLQGVITGLNKNLLGKEDEIASLNTRLYNNEVDKGKEIASLNTRLYNTEVEKEKEIASLNARLYNTEVEKEKEIASLNTRLYDTEVEKINKDLEIDNLKRELEKTSTELQRIYEMRLWKILSKFI